MPAGTKYQKEMNSDKSGIKTPAVYDPGLDEWLMLAANVVKTEGGVFLFQRGTADGRALVEAQLNGIEVAQTNGADAAAKSLLTAGKTAAGKHIPILVEADGKVVISGKVSSGGGSGFSYVSASTDDKPGEGSNATIPKEGEVLLEYDSRDEYTYTNAGTWVKTYDATLNQEVTIAPARDDLGVHRSQITAIDKVADFNADSVTVSDNGATGSLTNVAHYATVIPGNRWGPTKVSSALEQITPMASGSVRLAFAQATGAEWYDIFLSTDDAPKWVARVTEAQRAAGDYEVAAVGTVATGGGNPAGTVDVNVAGTGLQTSATIFSNNNAYLPAGITITPIDCMGKSLLYVHVKLALDDLRSAPTLSIIPFYRSYNSQADWFQGEKIILDLLNTTGQGLCKEFRLTVDACEAVVFLIDAISGQGAKATILTEAV